jgi:Protein of unknown function (DUF2786)
MTDQEKYADKIAALLRKAESTTPEEAELLFAKAQELMAKYAIDEAMLRQAGKQTAENPMEHQEFVTIGIYRHALHWLDVYCLWASGCELYELSKAGPREVNGRRYAQTRVIIGFGYRSDLERARLLATSLKLQCVRAEAAWWREHEWEYDLVSAGNKHAARRGFMLQFAHGAWSIMTRANAAAKEAAEAERGEESSDSSSVALVLANKKQMVRYEFEKRFPDLAAGRRSRMMQGDWNARQAGYAAGQKADVGDPSVGSSKRKALS